jgi:hypothetical protein
MDPEESRLLQFPSFHYFPLFRPIAPYIDYAGGRQVQTAGYGQLLLRDLDFMGAEKEADGSIKSTWARQLWRVQITFDPSQGNCPTKVVHFDNLDPDDLDAILSVNVIRWKEWTLSNGQSMWIPISFQIRHSTPELDLDFETEGNFRWQDTSKKSVMPVLGDLDDDWREGIRVLFEEDWSKSYDDWLRKQ